MSQLKTQTLKMILQMQYNQQGEFQLYFSVDGALDYPYYPLVFYPVALKLDITYLCSWEQQVPGE